MSGLYDPTPFTVTDGQRLSAAWQLLRIEAAKVEAALDALDPSRRTMMMELAELRHRVAVLTNELEARRALSPPLVTGPGAYGTTVAVAADGRTWEISR